MRLLSQCMISSCLNETGPAVANQQTREDLRDGAVGRCVHDAQRITDSVTMRSSCSNSPRPMVRFLLLWRPNSPLEEVAPPLRTSAALSSFSLILHPWTAGVSGDIQSFPIPKLVPAIQTASSWHWSFQSLLNKKKYCMKWPKSIISREIIYLSELH